MIRVRIRRQDGVETSTTSKMLGIRLVAVGLACVVLLLLGLWILLAIAFTTMAFVALVRAMLRRKSGARAHARRSHDHRWEKRDAARFELLARQAVAALLLSTRCGERASVPRVVARLTFSASA